MKEEWRKIERLGNEYGVSNLGNICKYEDAKRKIVTPHKDRCGYLRVSINGKTYAVHRLVAEAFIQNPYGYPIVHHIDENKRNNIASNLLWCTYQQNNIFGVPSRSGKSAKRKYVVVQMDMEGNVIAEYNTFEEAKRALGIKDSAMIAKCAKRSENRKTAYGYRWELKQENAGETRCRDKSILSLLDTAYTLDPEETKRQLLKIIQRHHA